MNVDENCKINDLKQKLKALGAKTVGNKAVLSERLKIWTDCNLNEVLCDITNVPAKSNEDFPNNVIYLPISSIKKDVFVSYEMIEKWFLERKAQKGLKKGRILSLKKFVKYTKVYVNGNNVFIKSVCAAEMKKSADYNVHLKLHNKNKEIYQAKCDCPAGMGWSAACKHIAAVLYSLEHFSLTGKPLEYVSCTSELSKWNKPAVVTGRAVGNLSIFEITNQRKPTFEYDDSVANNLLNGLINFGVNSPLLECRKVSNSGFMNDHSLYTKEYSNLILENINRISVDERSDIEESTRMQSISKKWFKVRESRITGSIIGAVMRTVKTKNFSEGPALKNILPPKNLSRIPAVAWGQENEHVARNLYMLHTGIEIERSGIWIHHQYNFLASSPDGVNFHLDLVIEIKCPFSMRNQSAENANFLEKCNGVVSLKRHHEYYAQCQLHMLVTNTSHCDFVVWTTKNLFIEHISKNDFFQEDLLLKSSLYFKEIFAPLYLKYH